MANKKKKKKVLESDVFDLFSPAAQGALQYNGVISTKDLAEGLNEDNILKLSGMNPVTLEKLKKKLAAKGLVLKKSKNC